MIQALAPGLQRGCSWAWLLPTLALLVPAAASAQDEKAKTKDAAASKPDAKKEASKKASAPAGKADAAPGATDAAKKGATPAKGAAPAAPAADAEPALEPDAPRTGTVEVFKDPKAVAALEVFKTVPGLRRLNSGDVSQVKAMAANQANVDRDVIQRYVDGQALELTDRANINGLINPPKDLKPTAKAARGIRDASEALIDPIATARLAKNDAFLRAYNQCLVATMPKLLDLNLVTRVEAMIVLGQAADVTTVPIFINQLKSTDQTVWVKLWAMRGLSNMVEGGLRTDSVLGATRAIEAAKTVVDFVQTEKELPWPVKMRAMETIGAMRQAAVPANLGKADMANAAVAALHDADASPEVRAWAAWALGMVRVNPAINRYNFVLVGHEISRLVADLGERVGRVHPMNPVQAERWAGLLAGPVFQSFNGVEGARESGLMHVPGGHPNYGPSQSVLKQQSDLSTAVVRAAVELVRGTPGQAKERRQTLAEKVAALKSFLQNTPPKDFHLVPDGPEFGPAKNNMAAEKEETAQVAGARGAK